MIRLIILIIVLLIFAVFSLLALPVLWLVSKKSPVAREKASDAIARFMFRLILLICGTKTTAIGLENIPSDRPVLFVGNHRGFFDVIISYTYIKGRAAYVAKKEIIKVPILRRWVTNIRCILLDRSNTRAALKSILTGTTAGRLKQAKQESDFFRNHEYRARQGDWARAGQYAGIFQRLQCSCVRRAPAQDGHTR